MGGGGGGGGVGGGGGGGRLIGKGKGEVGLSGVWRGLEEVE